MKVWKIKFLTIYWNHFYATLWHHMLWCVIKASKCMYYLQNSTYNYYTDGKGCNCHTPLFFKLNNLFQSFLGLFSCNYDHSGWSMKSRIFIYLEYGTCVKEFLFVVTFCLNILLGIIRNCTKFFHPLTSWNLQHAKCKPQASWNIMLIRVQLCLKETK